MSEEKAGEAQRHSYDPAEPTAETAPERKRPGRKRWAPTPAQIAAMSDAEYSRVCDELARGYRTACLRKGMQIADADDAASIYILDAIEFKEIYKYNGYSNTRLWSVAGMARRRDVADEARERAKEKKREESKDPKERWTPEAQRRDYGREYDASQARAGNPSRNYVDSEDARRVRDALNTLSLRESQVFFMWYQDDLSYEQIANHMNVAVSSVKTLLKRAKEQLRTELADLHGEADDRDWWDNGAWRPPRLGGLIDPNDDPDDRRFDDHETRIRGPDAFYLRSGEKEAKQDEKRELKFERLKEKIQDRKPTRRRIDE